LYANRSNGLGFAPAAVYAAAKQAKPLINVVSKIFGGGPKPMLYNPSDVGVMISFLSPSERAQLDSLLRPFGWYKGNASAVVDKITAELRDAKQPHERALYDFITSRMLQPIAQEDPSIGTDVTQAVKDVFVRRAAQTEEVRNLTRDVVTERTKQLSYEIGPIALAAGAALSIWALTRPRRNPRGRRRRRR
jgi:hypothetical protein